MNIVQAREAIYQRFTTLWLDQTEFTLDNEEFKPPSVTPWVRVIVRNTSSAQETLGPIGNRRYNRKGSIIIQVRVLGNTGTEQSGELADNARNIFEGTSFSQVNVNDSIVKEIGTDGKWFLTNVESFFFYEEIK